MAEHDRARRTIEQSFGLEAEGSPRRLTLREIKRSLARLRHRPPFWDGLALCFLIDPDRGDRLVMPGWLYDECQAEAGPAPRWVKATDLLDEVLVLRGHRPATPDVPVASAPLVQATCSVCAGTNLEHFYRSRTGGMILCAACFASTASPPR